jgi:hypothetical protein
MQKRIISEGVLDKLLSLFFKAKSEKKEDRFIANIRKKDPELANAWAKWDKDMDNSLIAMKQALEANNLPTDRINKIIGT